MSWEDTARLVDLRISSGRFVRLCGFPVPYVVAGMKRWRRASLRYAIHVGR